MLRVGKADLRAAFIAWCFDPGRQGTQAGWAREHDVEPATLSDWKKSAEFLEAAEDYKHTCRPAFAEATIVMLQLAKRGNVNAYRAVSAVLGENAPQQIESTVDRVAYVSPGALRELSERLYPAEPGRSGSALVPDGGKTH